MKHWTVTSTFEGCNETCKAPYSEKCIDKNQDKHAARKATPVFTGVVKYFPDALMEVARCSQAGQKQHNEGDACYWDRAKSGDELDALARHLIGAGTMDDDGVRHSAKVAWRALANLQKELEREGLAENSPYNE